MHYSFVEGETIAAISTPPGEGGIAVIRISGEHAFGIAGLIFSGPVQTYPTHTAHYGRIFDVKGETVDEVLLIVMRAPRSYTGEDTVEINCHGGGLITRRVLETVLKAGARAAFPGEFTLKAFMNGKLDLSQAEAVQELIGAKNERALDAAHEQLKGRLSQEIRGFQKELSDIAGILEAWVDFPEEDIEFSSVEEVCEVLERIVHIMQKRLATFHEGRLIHDGIKLCLVGRPNVGKSSLMNALLDKDRAIVTATPGTTRDVLEDHIRLNGFHVKLLDTAGIRETTEHIEMEGIRRSKAAMHEADVILFVIDASEGFTLEDKQLIEGLPSNKTILVWNKTDIKKAPEGTLGISALRKQGIEELKQAIDSLLWKHGPPSKEEIVITNVRHKEALERAILACEQVVIGLHQKISPEFLSFEMRQALSSLGSIIGTNITEDILSAIFSRFCIGK